MNKSGKMPIERRCEIAGVILLGLSTLLFLALVTDGYQMEGGARRYLDGMTETPNLLGRPGAITAGVLAILMGDAAHALYALIFIWGLMLFTHRPLDRLPTRLIGLILLTGSLAGLLQIDVSAGLSNTQAGGAFGAFLADRIFVPYFGVIGANVIGVTLFIIGLLLATDFLFVHVLVVTNKLLIHLFRGNLALFYAAARFAVAAWDRWINVPDRYADDEEDDEAGELRRSRRRKELVVRNHTEAAAALAEPERPAPRNTRTAPPEALPARRPMPMELPFDAVPALDEAGVTPKRREARVFATMDEEAPPPAAPTDWDAPTAQETSGATIENAARDDAELRRRPRKPRRKVETFDELPPDYEYPKQYTKPSIELFDRPAPKVVSNLGEQLRATSALLEETLQTFGIEARVTDVTRGPTITRYELEPAPGIKVSRFLALADDIALALKAHRVRVEAPIPGKGRVGIEVPNIERDPVLIRELLESAAFARGKGKLNLPLGKDIAGEVKIADLAAMPHLLVAGATGAGKTVCVKSLLAGLLFRHTPDELQLMLVDPKMVELSIFNDIPHLITPVVTDPRKASTSLNWLISEMEERYRLFAELRVRNIEVYNQSVENGEIEVEPDEGGAGRSLHLVRRLPYIICVIDELADLMMLARAEVEDAIGRLAQLARAVGIHLIIATQRPSVDVLTGVIKANFPARMSFQVSSRVDSRCILDEIGAERLVGLGDMLYLPAGQSKPTRIQGAFVSDREMNALVAYLKTQAPPQYRDEIENFGKTREKLEELADESDPLFDEAVQVVLETGQASISMVQRRLRVGYTRAARLIDMMELRGIVGPHIGSKAREILVSAPPEDDVA